MARRNKVAVCVEALGTIDLPASRAKAYELVRAHPGKTGLELERICGERLVQRRLSELEALGLLRCLDPRPCSVSGRRAHPYVLAENPAAADLRAKRETAADLRRKLDACRKEVRYLADRLLESQAEASVLRAALAATVETCEEFEARMARDFPHPWRNHPAFRNG